MSKASADMRTLPVPPMTRATAKIVRDKGARYHVKGRNGDRVKLVARGDVKDFGGSAVGRVRGIPPGFWRIVEEGSDPHLIVGRYRRQSGIGPRRRKSNARRTVLRILDSDSTFGASSPIRVGGIGYRQFAHHPGHGSLGKPWASGMTEAKDKIRREYESVLAKTMTKALTG
jgi:hypothetical protein